MSTLVSYILAIVLQFISVSANKPTRDNFVSTMTHHHCEKPLQRFYTHSSIKNEQIVQNLN